MIVIKEKRNGGKTLQLVQMLEQNPDAILLVCNGQERSRIICSFQLTPAQGNRIFSWNNYTGERIMSENTDILIDNVDLYLQERFNFRVLGVSLSGG